MIEFPNDKRVKKDGKEARCKACRGLYHSEWMKTNENDIQRRKAYNKQYKKANIERVKELKRKWTKNNLPYKAYKCAERRAYKMQATIGDYNFELKEIYKNKPAGYQVDHIIPLKNKDICGLHVPWNLQYLTIAENLKKGNRIIREKSDDK